jgi:hypothetical protein
MRWIAFAALSLKPGGSARDSLKAQVVYVESLGDLPILHDQADEVDVLDAEFHRVLLARMGPFQPGYLRGFDARRQPGRS